MPAPFAYVATCLPLKSVPVDVSGGWNPELPGVPGDQYGSLNFVGFDVVPPPFHGPTSPTGTPLAEPEGVWTSTQSPARVVSGKATKISVLGFKPLEVVEFSCVWPFSPRPSKVPLTVYHGDKTTWPKREAISQFPYIGKVSTYPCGFPSASVGIENPSAVGWAHKNAPPPHPKPAAPWLHPCGRPSAQ